MYISYPVFKRLKPSVVYEFRVFGYSSSCFLVHEQSYWIIGSDVPAFILSNLARSLPKSVSEVSVYLYTTTVVDYRSVPDVQPFARFTL